MNDGAATTKAASCTSLIIIISPSRLSIPSNRTALRFRLCCLLFILLLFTAVIVLRIHRAKRTTVGMYIMHQIYLSRATPQRVVIADIGIV